MNRSNGRTDSSRVAHRAILVAGLVAFGAAGIAYGQAEPEPGDVVWTTTSDINFGYWDEAKVVLADSTGLYVGGASSMNGPATGALVQKRSKTTGSLQWSRGTTGGVNMGVSVRGLASDSTGIYAASDSESGGVVTWVVHKLNIADGSDIWSQSYLGDQGDRPAGIAVDSSGVYIVGTEWSWAGINPRWRIEKRDLSTGALIGSFGSGGAIYNDPSGGSDGAEEVVIDATGIYILGTDSVGGSTRLRIEKRDLGTGGIIWVWAAVSPLAGASALAIDGTGLYVGGSDNDPGNEQWRLEKRSLADGSLIASFGTSGVVTSNPSSSGEGISGLAVDATGIYVVGSDKTPGNYQWRVEKRSPTDGALYWFRTVNPTTGGDDPRAVAVDGTGAYLAGYEYVGPGFSGGDANWRIEKRDIFIPMKPTNLTVDAASLNTSTPDFSAQFNDPADSSDQFQIEVATASATDPDGTFVDANLMWTPAASVYPGAVLVASGTQSPWIDYAGTALTGGTTYFWHMRMRDTSGRWSAWSAVSSFTPNGAPTACTNLTVSDTQSPVPGFSARFNDPNVSDTADKRRIQVAPTSLDLDNGTNLLWNEAAAGVGYAPATSQGTQTTTFSYGGTPLSWNTTYWWRIKLWDAAGVESPWWSANTSWAMPAPTGTWSLNGDAANARWTIVAIPTGTSVATSLVSGFTGTWLAWDEATQGYVAATTLQPGRAYFVKASGGALTLNGGTATGTAMTLTNLSVTAGGWSGWHMIGNPFNGTIDWNAVTVSGIEPKFWAYDHKLNGQKIYVWYGQGAIGDGGAYDYWDAMDGGATGSWAGAGPPKQGRYIPKFRGFWIHATSGTNSITIPAPATYGKPEAQAPPFDKAYWRLRMDVRAGELDAPHRYAGVYAEATDGLDGYDVLDRNEAEGDYLLAYFVIDGQRHVQDMRPARESQWELAVETNAVPVDVELTFPNAAELPAGWEWRVVDPSSGQGTVVAPGVTFAYRQTDPVHVLQVEASPTTAPTNGMPASSSAAGGGGCTAAASNFLSVALTLLVFTCARGLRSSRHANRKI